MERREKIENHGSNSSLHAKKATGISLSNKAQSRIQTAKQQDRNIIKPSQQRRIEREKQRQKPPIPSYIKKDNKKPETPKKNNENLTMKSYLDDPDCIQLRQDIEHGASIADVEPERLQALNLHLREYAVQSAKERNYPEAKNANAMIDFVNSELQFRASQVVIDRTLENEYERGKDDTIQKHQKEREDLEERFNIKRENLENQLNQELDEFEEQWRTEMPRKYRKPSSTLLELIDKENRFAKAGDFDGAAIVKKEVDALEEKEARDAQRHMIRDYKAAKEKFLKNQQQKRDTLENKYSRQLDCLYAQQKLELDQLDNRMNVVNQKQIEQLNTKSGKIATAHASTHVMIQSRERVLPDLIAPNDEEKIQEFERKERERKKNAAKPAKADEDEDVKLFITNAVAEAEQAMDEPASDEDGQENDRKQENEHKHEDDNKPENENKQDNNENKEEEKIKDDFVEEAEIKPIYSGLNLSGRLREHLENFDSSGSRKN